MPKFSPSNNYFHLPQQNSDLALTGNLSSSVPQSRNEENEHLNNNHYSTTDDDNKRLVLPSIGNHHEECNHYNHPGSGKDLDDSYNVGLFAENDQTYYPEDRVYSNEDNYTKLNSNAHKMSAKLISNQRTTDEEDTDGMAVRFAAQTSSSSAHSPIMTGTTTTTLSSDGGGGGDGGTNKSHHRNVNASSGAGTSWRHQNDHNKTWWWPLTSMIAICCRSSSSMTEVQKWRRNFCILFTLFCIVLLFLLLLLAKAERDKRHLKEKYNVSDSSTTEAPFPTVINNICTTSSCVKAASNLLQAIDFGVDPCANFFDYACGQWNKDHPIPDDVAAYGTFAYVRDLVRQQLKGLLDEPSIEYKHQTKPVKMAKLFYRTCMNASLINRAGTGPIMPALKQLGGWPLLNSSWRPEHTDLTTLISQLRRSFAVDVFVSLFVYADSKDTSTNILTIDKGSLGLGAGTRDYYLNDSIYGNHMAAYRKFLIDVVSLMATDLRVPMTRDVINQANDIIEFEKRFANITTPEDQRRNHSLLYNKWTVKHLNAEMSEIDWNLFFRTIMPPNVWQLANNPDYTLIVNEPAFMRDLNDLLRKTDKRTVVNYIIWRFIKMWSKILDNRFDDAFQEFAQVMLGRQQKPVRWKNCVPATVLAFDMAVGALYVERHFKQEDKMEALNMIEHLQRAFRQLVHGLDWMDADTKVIAIDKAKAMLNHIGYPDFLLNETALNVYYSDLDIISESMSYFQMNQKISLWLQNKDLNELMKPFDRNKFDTSPAIVNAFYSPEKNAITFPAGILQPPFFKGDYPKAINYGAMGAVIGHEITHGFDDQGSQYDKDGNLNDWWTPSAFEGFRKRTECIIEQYNNYTVVEVKTKVNGKLTQGENIADNGGVKEAYVAYKKYLSELGDDEPRLPGLLNLTNYQLFFLSYANFWCGHKKPAAALQQVLTDPHSPEMFRVIGVLSNMDEFAQAFQCRPGTPMNPLPSQRPRCRVW